MYALAVVAAGCGRVAFDPLALQSACAPAAAMDAPYANSTDGADGATDDTAFAICTEVQLAEIAQRPEHWGSHFRLASDIELIQRFTPIANVDVPFTGAFDGAGFTIDRLSVDEPTNDDVGMFRFLGDGARIHDLTLTNVDVTGADETGALAGVSNGATIDSVSISGKVTGATPTGGLIGDAESSSAVPAPGLTVSNVNVEVIVQSESNSGGLIGILAFDDDPGLARLTDIAVSGDITGGNAMGGLVGNMGNAIIERAAASIAVHARTDAGGIVGSTFSRGEIRYSSAAGDVDCTGPVCGGLAADGITFVSHSSATGRVTCGSIECAGLVAAPYGPVEYSFATGDVMGTDLVGGLVATPNSMFTLTDSYATGNVTGNDQVGGLLASLATNSTITRSYATGTVSGRDHVGGLVGEAIANTGSATISESFATGSVSGTSGTNAVSLIVGSATGAVSQFNLYASANATCTNTGGGCSLSGSAPVDPTLFYSSTQPPLTTWDFTSVWREVADSYPELR